MEKKRRNSKKIIFMGTPWIATNALKALIELDHEIVCVVTQPDKLIGRKKEVIFSPIKNFCIENKIKIYQPFKIIDVYDELFQLEIDYIITCAYGQFVPDKILNIPRYGAYNVHASLLPKYRGGAPIQWSIINGEKITGISFIKMNKKMDSGDIFFTSTLDINDNDNSESLTKNLGNLIYNSLLENFDKFINNLFEPISQDESKVTFAYNIKREDEKINWNQNCENIYNFIRGLNPKPNAFSIYEKKEIKILESKKTKIKSINPSGTICKIDKEAFYVATKDFDIAITKFQIEGKQKIEFSKFFPGNKFFLINKNFF